MRRYSIRTCFDTNRLPVLTDEALEPITDRYLKGDNECKNLIIESNIKLAISLAALFAARYPFRADDLGGQALWLLTHHVHKFPSKARDNRIRGYLHSNVWHGLQRFCREDHLIKVSESTLYYQKVRGKNIKFEIEDVDKVLYGRSAEEKLPESRLLDWSDPSLPVDNLELVEAEIVDDAEILKLRLLGFGDKEISDAILQPVTYVIDRKQQIINRLTFVLRELEHER